MVHIEGGKGGHFSSFLTSDMRHRDPASRALYNKLYTDEL